MKRKVFRSFDDYLRCYYPKMMAQRDKETPLEQAERRYWEALERYRHEVQRERRRINGEIDLFW
jgi:hypothetical protein